MPDSGYRALRIGGIRTVVIAVLLATKCDNGITVSYLATNHSTTNGR